MNSNLAILMGFATILALGVWVSGLPVLIWAVFGIIVGVLAARA